MWYIGIMMNNQSTSLTAADLGLIIDLLEEAAADEDNAGPTRTRAANAVTRLRRLEVDQRWTGRGQSIHVIVKHWSMGD